MKIAKVLRNKREGLSAFDITVILWIVFISFCFFAEDIVQKIIEAFDAYNHKYEAAS